MVTYVKISDLPVATEATGTDELEVNQAGVSRKITVDQIADHVADILPPAIPETPEDIALWPFLPIDGGTLTGLVLGVTPDPSAVGDELITAEWALANVSGGGGGPAELPITGGDPVDTGLSRISAGVVGVGNGTAGSTSGTLNAAAVNLTGALVAASGAFGDQVYVTNSLNVNNNASAFVNINANDAGAGRPTLLLQKQGNARFQINATPDAGVYYEATSSAPAHHFAFGAAPVFTVTPTAATLTGALAGTTATLSTAISAASNDTTVPTTAWVKANAGSATSTTVTPPATPTDGQMWWNSDASTGGGQLFIRYNDGSTTQWVPASPGVGSGSVVQTVSFQTGASATGTTLIPSDDTVPQITEGNEYMTLSITPKSATSKLVIEVNWAGSSDATSSIIVALFQDATANALAVALASLPVGTARTTIPLRHTMTSGTTSSTTFRVRAGGHVAGTTTFNGVSGGRLFGGVMASSIVIQEVL